MVVRVKRRITFIKPNRGHALEIAFEITMLILVLVGSAWVLNAQNDTSEDTLSPQMHTLPFTKAESILIKPCFKISEMQGDLPYWVIW